jgi:hypothetical protein
MTCLLLKISLFDTNIIFGPVLGGRSLSFGMYLDTALPLDYLLL